MKTKIFYRLLLSEFGLSDLNFANLNELNEKRNSFIKDKESNYYEYWIKIYNNCKAVKVTETFEEIIFI